MLFRSGGYNPTFFPDGKRMLFSQNGLKVYDIETQKITELGLQGNTIDFLEISQDGKFIAIGYWWQSGQNLPKYSCEVWDGINMASLGFLFKDEENPQFFYSMQFSKNSELLGIRQYYETVRIFKTNDLSLTRTYNELNIPQGSDSFSFIGDSLIALTTIDKGNKRYIFINPNAV